MRNYVARQVELTAVRLVVKKGDRLGRAQVEQDSVWQRCTQELLTPREFTLEPALQQWSCFHAASTSTRFEHLRLDQWL